MNHIFLLAEKSREAIRISSMRYFETIASLEEHIKIAKMNNIRLYNWYIQNIF
jgi:hypothetical protein